MRDPIQILCDLVAIRHINLLGDKYQGRLIEALQADDGVELKSFSVAEIATWNSDTAASRIVETEKRSIIVVECRDLVRPSDYSVETEDVEQRQLFINMQEQFRQMIDHAYGKNISFAFFNLHKPDARVANRLIHIREDDLETMAV